MRDTRDERDVDSVLRSGSIDAPRALFHDDPSLTISQDSGMEALHPFVGEWRLHAVFKDVPPSDVDARVRFEWLPGERFLVQRWEIPVPEAPDGIAVIGPDSRNEGRYLQHYFDSRGVARVYRMSFENGIWKLWRDTPDFSPLNFAQRYTGAFSPDGSTITGAWEIREDRGSWERDFDLTYIRI